MDGTMIMWIFPLLFTVALSDNPTTNDEYNLRSELAKHADSIRQNMRPVLGPLNQTVTVQHGLALIHLLKFSEDTREFTGHFFTRMTWSDANMKWNPKDYHGISMLRIQTDNMWNPDIVLYNSVDFDRKEYLDHMKVLSSEGNILWVPNSHYSVLCSSGGDNDVDADFTCSLKFGSWVYDDSDVSIQMYDEQDEQDEDEQDEQDEVDMTDMVDNRNWKVWSGKTKRNEKQYPCCEEIYSDLTYTLYLKRR